MWRLSTFLLVAVLSATLFQISSCADTLTSIQTVALDLSGVFNIKAASTGVDDTFADFDGSQRAYPVEWLPDTATFDYDGIKVQSLRHKHLHFSH